MRRRSHVSRARRAQIRDEALRLAALTRTQGRSIDDIQQELLRRFDGELEVGEARMYAEGWTIRTVREGLVGLAMAEGLDASGLEESDVWRWLRGEVYPRDRLLHLCRLFRCHQADLGGPPRGNEWPFVFTSHTERDPQQMPPQRGGASPGSAELPQAAAEFLTAHTSTSSLVDDAERQVFLGWSASAGSLASSSLIEPWERLSRVLTRQSMIDENTVRAMEARTAALHQMETTIPARQLFRHLEQPLDALADLLTASPAPAIRRRLVVASGETAVLGGWMAWDLGNQAAAQQLYRLAISASHEADDPAIAACALAYMSYAAGAAGARRQAQALLVGARDRIDHMQLPATYAWLAAREAEELTISDRDQALRLIEQSLASYREASHRPERPWTTFLDESRMASFAMTVNLKCGRVEEARQIAEQVLQSPGSPKTRALHVLELAGTHLRIGSIDEGLELTERALSGVLETEMTWGVPKLKELSRLLRSLHGSNKRAHRGSPRLAAVPPTANHAGDPP